MTTPISPEDDGFEQYLYSLQPQETTLYPRPDGSLGVVPINDVPRRTKVLSIFQNWLERRDHDLRTSRGPEVLLSSQEHLFVHAAHALRDATKAQVSKIVQDFDGFSDDDDKKTCLELVSDTPIFPGLVAYTFTHLISCPPRGWVFNANWSRHVLELKVLVESWRKNSDMWCLKSYRSIKSHVLGILHSTRVRPEEHKCNVALLDGASVIKQDILNFVALAALCITGPEKAEVVNASGTDATDLIELFHALLEMGDLGDDYRRCLLNPLVSLSFATRHIPSSLHLTDDMVDIYVGYGFVRDQGPRFCQKLRVDEGHSSAPDLWDSSGSPRPRPFDCRKVMTARHLHHPNCLPLYGLYEKPAENPDTPTRVSHVQAWTVYDISEYLKSNPAANRTLLVLEVVRGLHYLHSMDIIHRDLRPENILITCKGRACLTGLGTSWGKVPCRFSCRQTRYLAPEIIWAGTGTTGEKLSGMFDDAWSKAGDMYSLACVIYEIYTGHPPLHDRDNQFQLRAMIAMDIRPEYPEGDIPPDMWCLIENLWSGNPSHRITIDVALAWMEFQASRERLKPSPPEVGWNWKGCGEVRLGSPFSVSLES